MKVLIAGDLSQKYRVDTVIKEKHFDKLFNTVSPIIKTVDYSIVNLEFPIIVDPSKAKRIHKCGPNLHGTTESIDAIKYVGFKCCTLSNNHILDYGGNCGIDTKLLLESAKIDTVGFGENLNSAAKTLYKNIKNETLAIINCCEHEFSIATEISAGANPLNPIQQWYKIKEAKEKSNYVIIIVHGGHECYQLPSPRMKEIYRFFIDAGADAVINHHQHCYSGYEIYNNRPIFYGLGNFLFDHSTYRHHIWNEGYMVTLDFSEEQPSFTLHPYNQCNESPIVTLMNDKGYMEFLKKIARLNKIITDEELLQKEHEAWMKRTSKNMQTIFEPYITRLGRMLFNRGFLPSMIDKKKKYQILNYINCESHLDRLRYIIECNK